MSSEPDFRCPVCRARQTYRDACRRCGADLTLVVRALRRSDYLVRALRTARTAGQQSRAAELDAELSLLNPRQRMDDPTRP